MALPPFVEPDVPGLPPFVDPDKQRSTLAEIGTGFKRLLPAAQQAAAATSAGAQEIAGTPVDSFTQRALAQSKAALQENAPQPEGRSWLTNALASAPEAIGGFAPMAGAAAVGGLAGPVGAAAGMAAQQGAQRYHEALEEARNAQKPEDQARSFAGREALLSGGLAAAFPAVGPLARVAGKAVSGGAAKTALETGQQLLSRQADGFLPTFAKHAAEGQAGLTGYSAAQSAGSDINRQQAGLPSVGALEAAKQGAVQSLEGGVAFAPIWARGAHVEAKQSAQVAQQSKALATAITDPTALPQDRILATNIVAREMHAVDPAQAEQFRNNALRAIALKQPIAVEESWLKPLQGPPAPSPEQMLHTEPIDEQFKRAYGVAPGGLTDEQTAALQQAQRERELTAQPKPFDPNTYYEGMVGGTPPPEPPPPAAPGIAPKRPPPESPLPDTEVPASPDLGKPTRPVDPEDAQRIALGDAFRQNEAAQAAQKQRELAQIANESREPVALADAATGDRVAAVGDVPGPNAMQAAMQKALQDRAAAQASTAPADVVPRSGEPVAPADGALVKAVKLGPPPEAIPASELTPEQKKARAEQEKAVDESVAAAHEAGTEAVDRKPGVAALPDAQTQHAIAVLQSDFNKVRQQAQSATDPNVAVAYQRQLSDIQDKIDKLHPDAQARNAMLPSEEATATADAAVQAQAKRGLELSKQANQEPTEGKPAPVISKTDAKDAVAGLKTVIDEKTAHADEVRASDPAGAKLIDAEVKQHEADQQKLAKTAGIDIKGEADAATRNTNQLQARSQDVAGTARTTGADVAADVRKRATEAGSPQAVSGNGAATGGNAEGAVLGPQGAVQARQRRNVPTGSDRGGLSVRASAGDGAPVGPSAPDIGARSPSGSQRTEQRAGESALADSGGARPGAQQSAAAGITGENASSNLPEAGAMDAQARGVRGLQSDQSSSRVPGAVRDVQREAPPRSIGEDDASKVARAVGVGSEPTGAESARQAGAAGMAGGEQGAVPAVPHNASKGLVGSNGEEVTQRRALVDSIRSEIGWAEEGGHMIREGGDRDAMVHGLVGANQGEVVGRTAWVPKSEFWPGRPKTDSGRGISVKAAEAALEKYVKGEKLSGPEKRFVDYAVQVHDERKAIAAAASPDFTEAELDDIRRRAPDELTVEAAKDGLTADAKMAAAGLTEAEREVVLERAAMRADNGDDYGKAIDEEIARANGKRGSAGRAEGAPGADAELATSKPKLELAGETNAEVLAAEKAKAAAEAKAAEDAKAEAQRAEADRQRAGFGLTGSDRKADANPGQKGIFDLDAGWRKNLEFTTGLGESELRKIVDTITAHFEGRPEFVIKPMREWGFDRNKIEQAIKVGATVRGAFVVDNGKQFIYLDPETITTQKGARYVLQHELTHKGLLGIAGDKPQLRATMQRIYDSNDAIRAKADKWMADQGVNDKMRATEEVLATMGGLGEWRNVKGWQLLFGQVRQWARSFFPNMKWTDNDVAAMISRAQKQAETGEGAKSYGNSNELSSDVGGDPLYSGLAETKFPRERILDSLRRIVAPASRGEIAQQEAGILRHNFADQAQSIAKADAAMQQYAKAFSKLSKADSISFIDSMEAGRPIANAELNQIAVGLRTALDAKRGEVQALGLGKLDDFYTNYFPHIWRDDKAAQNVFARRPLEGPKSFLQRRIYQTFRQGLVAGLDPISYNPVELVLLKMREMDRYIYAQKAFAEMKATGLTAAWAPGEQPAGWTQLNDKIANAGDKRYFAPDEAATLINNHLSPGLQGNGAYDAFRQAGIILNSAQLGLSAFHLGFTTVDAMVSKAALGIGQVSRGDFLRGIGSLAQSVSPTTPFVNLYRGDRLLRAYLGQLNDPGLVPIVEALKAGGGRGVQDMIYRNQVLNEFKQALVRGDKIGAVKSFLPMVIDKMNAPIFNYLVPRQKLGVFFDLAQDWIRRNPNATLEQKRIAMGKAWDSVDNRMGQLAYDNLFWNKVLKDSLMVSVRSVGWNLGTFRELGGGVADIGSVLKNKELSSRTAYLIALPFTTAVMGSIIGYMYTGNAPEDTKDMFFPRTGRKRPDGTEDRVSLPSYMKDIYEYGHDFSGFAKYGADPTQTLRNKMHPLLGMVGQMLSNQDFFGAAIRAPGSQLEQQLQDEANYLYKQIQPFGVSGFEQQQKLKNESGFDPLGYLSSPSIVGVTPSPGYITKNEQQTESAALSRQKDALISKFRQDLADGAVPGDVVRRAFAAGLRQPEITMILHQGLAQAQNLRVPSRLPPRQLRPTE